MAVAQSIGEERGRKKKTYIGTTKGESSQPNNK
jgi:hypothetical protein